MDEEGDETVAPRCDALSNAHLHRRETLADLPNAQNVKALMNHQYGYRLRVGNYRVLFDVDIGIRIVDVQEIKKRDDNTY